MTENERYWIAAWLDAEGNFGPSGYSNSKTNPKKYTSVMVQGWSTDLDTVERVRKLINGGVSVAPRTGKQKKQLYRIYLYGFPAVELMLSIYPLMSARRQIQIKQTLFNYPKLMGLLKQKLEREEGQ